MSLSDSIFATSNAEFFGTTAIFGDPRDVFAECVANPDTPEIFPTNDDLVSVNINPVNINPVNINLVNINSENIIGTPGNDILSAYDLDSQEVDTLTGGFGADAFVAGDSLIGAYYLGPAYALVTDYSFIEGDVILLGSNALEEYTYQISDFGLGNQTLDTVIFSGNDPIIALQDTTEFNFLFI